jgi:putative protease
MKRIELLAPAGSMEALVAAVENGADAVYLGGNMFSARQYANNFTIEELKKAVDYAHERSVKIYVAVNTLLTNDEIKDLIPYLYQLAEVHIDAIIVQDLGVASIIKNCLPQMELHASTQMAVHNSQGVKYLEKMGFTRVVLAREVSFENINLIKHNSSLELETFVHGALCVAYSGQCLMSSMIGGRSGNRGRCAQPCRLKYSLVDSKGKLIIYLNNLGEHLLSPKDLKMIQHIPELVNAGIVSFKIEGRMKRPEYVATVVRNYRQAIDSYYENSTRFNVSKKMEKELEQIFNRGFTTGYYFINQGKNLMSYKRPNNRGLLLGRIINIEKGFITVRLVEPLSVGDGYEVWVSKGGRIAGEVKEIIYKGKKIKNAVPDQEVAIKVSGKPQIGDRVFKTHDIKIIDRARESYMSPKIMRKINLYLNVVIEEGEKIRISARDGDGYLLSITGDYIVEKAQKHPLNNDILWKQFSRLGNTPFRLVDLQVSLNDELMVPISELNKLRHQVVDGLLNIRKQELEKDIPDRQVYLKSFNEFSSEIPPKQTGIKKPLLSILVGNYNAVKEAINSGADQVYMNLEGLKNKPGFTLETLKESIDLCHKRNVKAILRLPRIISEIRLENLREFLNNIKKINLDGILAGNLGTLHLVNELKFKNIYADYTLNIFNDFTIQKLLDSSIVQATLSPELTIEQISEFSYLGNIPLEVIVHGNFPLMISEYCAVGSILGDKNQDRLCNGACRGKDYGLKDRMNFVFPIEMDENCRMLIYNAKPLNLFRDLNKILNTGINVIRIEGRKENAKWVEIVTRTYRQAIDNWSIYGEDYHYNEHLWQALEHLDPGGFTTGHYFRGVL